MDLEPGPLCRFARSESSGADRSSGSAWHPTNDTATGTALLDKCYPDGDKYCFGSGCRNRLPPTRVFYFYRNDRLLSASSKPPGHQRQSSSLCGEHRRDGNRRGQLRANGPIPKIRQLDRQRIGRRAARGATGIIRQSGLHVLPAIRWGYGHASLVFVWRSLAAGGVVPWDQAGCSRKIFVGRAKPTRFLARAFG